jgi:hypothetical protein
MYRNVKIKLCPQLIKQRNIKKTINIEKRLLRNEVIIGKCNLIKKYVVKYFS